jgi:phosphoribosyl-ATP pyrophosphohydrolase/phosphoribosyl-AMP cyclohydrolase
MNPNFDKNNGLIPVIIQHHLTQQVLMLGYMNQEALAQTQTTHRVTFFSRSKNRLWVKGETSGHFLTAISMAEDCDKDTLLIQAKPAGPVCHTGSTTCFNEETAKGFLYALEDKISERIDSKTEGSYTYQLFVKGINKVAQKVGEEAVELVIEAKDNNDHLFKNEAADLLYHFLILLKAKNFTLTAIEEVLKERLR